MQEAYEALVHPRSDAHRLIKLLPLEDEDHNVIESPGIHMLQDGIKKHCQMMDLQPGSILIINEHNLFHHAHAGVESAITDIPPDITFSRVLVHNAAARSGGDRPEILLRN